MNPQCCCRKNYSLNKVEIPGIYYFPQFACCLQVTPGTLQNRYNNFGKITYSLLELGFLIYFFFFFRMRSSALKCCSAQTFLFHENSLNCKLSQCGVLIWEAVYAGDVYLCCVSCTRAVSLPQDVDDESFLFYLLIPANHQIVCSCIHYCINDNIV